MALGKHYNAGWLVASCYDKVDGKFDFCRKEEGVGVVSGTRYAMLFTDGMHYQAILHQGRGSFLMEEMPSVVRKTWNIQ